MTEVSKFTGYCLYFSIGKVAAMKCRPGSLPMEGFVASCTDGLADRLKSHVVIALKNDGVEPIHDLRVAGRRLRNALRLFKNFYAKRTRKDTRREVKEVM